MKQKIASIASQNAARESHYYYKVNTHIVVLIPADIPKQVIREVIESILENRKKYALSGLSVAGFKEEERARR